MKIVTTDEIKEMDRRATSDFKIPSLLLMENAARGVVDAIEKKMGGVAGKRVTLLCGSGHNGGDGIAAARHLHIRSAKVHLFLLAPVEKQSGDTKVMLDAWIAREGVWQVIGSFSQEEMIETLSRSDLIIDAILGTGLSHQVAGEYKNAIDCMNNVRQNFNIPIVSIDIPSGISADTGEMMGAAVWADYTLTIALPKRGLFLWDGLEHRGEWDVIDIGFPKKLIDQADIKVNLAAPAVFSPATTPDHSPPRVGAHKGDFGHLLVIAGSRGKQGAAAMTALSAMRSGVGLVTVALPQSIDTLLPAAMEIMTLPVLETSEGTLSLPSESMLLEAAKGKEAVAIGPGLSHNQETVRVILNLISQITAPIVIDADGINALATDLSVLKKRHRQTHGTVILTPHPGEMGRLLGSSADVVQKNRIEIASQFAKDWDVMIVLKGAHTIIADPNGDIFLAHLGNPGMATAGTGDVLTGIIGGALAQGMDPRDAALWGVLLHGRSGDMASRVLGERSCMAHDLIEKIPEASSTLSSPASQRSGPRKGPTHRSRRATRGNPIYTRRNQ